MTEVIHGHNAFSFYSQQQKGRVSGVLLFIYYEGDSDYEEKTAADTGSYIRPGFCRTLHVFCRKRGICSHYHGKLRGVPV